MRALWSMFEHVAGPIDCFLSTPQSMSSLQFEKIYLYYDWISSRVDIPAGSVQSSTSCLCLAASN